MVACPYCNMENRQTARYCLGCGKFINPAPTADDGVFLATGTLPKGAVLQDRYVIRSLLSAGGMGYVYRAHDNPTGQDVAIKEMIDRFTTSDARRAAMEFFRREVDLLATLRHRAIPRVHRHFWENQRSYIVMDLVEGIDLRRMLTRLQETGKTLPLEMALQWALEICDVLNYLHSHNPPVIYRDMKPSNIMVTPRGSIRLVDFGIARFFAPKIRGTMVGTQGYSPPEQYRGHAEPRSDVYSLGATLHHLLTGRDPQLEAPFDFPPIREFNPDFPPELEAIVNRALHLNPDQRYPGITNMKNALERLISARDLLSDLNRQIDSIQDHLEQLRRRRTSILAPYGELLEGPGSQPSHIPEAPQEIKKGWRQFKGNPYRTGHSPVSASLQGRLKWSRKVGAGVTSSVIIDENENLYFGCANEFCCYSKRGKIQWSYRASGIVSSTPAMDNQGNFYLADEKGGIHSLGPDGSRRWLRQVENPVKAAILLHRNRLYVADIDGGVKCFDPNGDILWMAQAEGPVVASPTAGRTDNIFIGIIPGILRSVSLDGDMHWSAKLPGMITSAPVSDEEGFVYLGCEDNHLYALDNSGGLQWKFRTNGWIRSSPAISREGTIYFGSSDSKLYALDSQGMEKWRFDASDVISTAVGVSDDGGVYFATQKGFLFALHPYGKSRWWFNLNAPVETSPAIAPSGDIYIGTTEGYLFSIT